HPRLGFLGAWFFLLLAPSSSIVPIPLETVAEHRMYLPLAAIVILFVLAAVAVLRDRRACVGLLSIAVVALGVAAILRNHVYRDEYALWGDTVAKRPDNARARMCLANSLLNQDRVDDALRQLQTAVQIAPGYGEARQNLGVALHRAGRQAEAEQAWRDTIEI